MKVLLIVFIIFISIGINAQDTKTHYGLSLGFNYPTIHPSVLYKSGDRFSSPGFEGGVFLEIMESPSLSFVPKMILAHHFAGAKKNGFANYVFPLSLDLMVHLKFKPYPSDKAFYYIAGPDYRISLTDYIETDSLVKGNRNDIAFEIGVGRENKFNPLWSSIELKYSLGIRNLDQSIYTSYMKFHKVSLLFQFKY